jgi:3-oxo-5-alpha-steroid 4-dehydrogenase 1
MKKEALKRKVNYLLPKGGLFDYISAPNYFGEILLFFGYFLFNLEISALVFAVCNMIILGKRAIKTKRWYREKFENYPKTTKAIIPFII